ncbi:MAG: mandelate racemase/muconate lactonizing protein, partial [Chloroflexi bacterium]|nr:mandelate racemase/muconate lactonizing protein [Chloroflexota bacterium]
RDAVPAYASCLGYSLEPEAVYERATALKAEGYTAQKWFFRYGPGHGRAALERNMVLVRTLREAVGDDVDLMFDAWLGWDVPFAVEMGLRMAEYAPRWLEEPVPPDRIGAYAEIRRQTGIPIAGGEHEYTRWGFKVLLDAEGVDVIQADPDWTGGLSEMVKICALASAYDRQVVPHGHSVLPALHLIAAQSPEVCPLLEFLILHNARKQWFHVDKFFPEGGLMRLPEQPGLGITLDPARVLKRQELSWG